MDDRAFSSGIASDGLRSRREIKILVCFILSRFSEPINRHDLIEIIQRDGLANYLETCAAIAALLENGNVMEEEEDMLTVTESGKTVGNSLLTSLPYSVRDKALTAGMQIVARRRSEKENRVELIPTGNGITVKCDIMNAGLVLASASLYVPDARCAELVKERFLEDPESLYRLILVQLADVSLD